MVEIDAGSAYFVGPVIAVALSVTILREVMTFRKGLSLALSVIGSLVVLRPTGEIDPGLLLAFGACLLYTSPSPRDRG